MPFVVNTPTDSSGSSPSRSSFKENSLFPFVELPSPRGNSFDARAGQGTNCSGLLNYLLLTEIYEWSLSPPRGGIYANSLDLAESPLEFSTSKRDRY